MVTQLSKWMDCIGKTISHFHIEDEFIGIRFTNDDYIILRAIADDDYAWIEVYNYSTSSRRMKNKLGLLSDEEYAAYKKKQEDALKAAREKHQREMYEALKAKFEAPND